MNRFLAKKKCKEDVPPPRASIESESSSPFRMFAKNKRAPDEEPKPEAEAEVDLTNALPSSDDFRTSLLMTGLSARFSMLREQDDPTTKVGKASDDSVLFPKTQSRLHEYGLDRGLRDLSDLDLHDLESLASEVSGTSSIMNRGKPTDGNNLFGGRQKIYRIPANGPGVGKNGGMPGRALYDDDVALSGFQKWKQAEKEKEEKGKQLVEEAANSKAAEPEFRPSFSRRGTSSSTISSMPSTKGRTSSVSNSIFSAQRTASVKKEPPPVSQNAANLEERSVTKTRRLYEQGLNQNLVDQQSNTFSRMNSLTKARAFGALASEVNAPIGDRRQILAQASAPNLRSHPPAVPEESRNGFGATPPLNPPLSPPISESDGQTSATREQPDPLSDKPPQNIPVDIQTTSFFDDSDASSLLNQAIGPAQTPRLSVERPDDDDHPAFRKTEPLEASSLAAAAPGKVGPGFDDSPTLGPNTGLSGMVRAHLRSGSAASSVYTDTNVETRGDSTTSGHEASPARASSSGRQTASAPRSPSRLGDEADKEQDEFAKHLADGARRIREKLTSYVDADPDRAVPLASSPVEAPKELNPPRATLGLLRSKSSRSSLFDREHRNGDGPKSLKTSMTVSGIPAALLSPRKVFGETDEGRGAAGAGGEQPDEGEDNIPLGLKAFRQARRELQKVKEMETQQKHQSGVMRPLAFRTMSFETSGMASPSPYGRMAREEAANGNGSLPGSRAPSERDRSGSDTSNSGRGSRMRNGSGAAEEHGTGSPGGGLRRMAYTSNGSDSRPRTGSNGVGSGALPGTMTSMPPPVGAPPLPPLNPRRKNGARGEDESPLTSPRMPGGFPAGDDGSDDETAAERRQRLRRATSEGNSLQGRARNSPPRNGGRAPPLPQGGFPQHGRLPGGMI